MKKLLLITSISFSLIASTSILAKNPNILVCPSVNALQSIPLDKAIVIGPIWGAAVFHNKYDTDTGWAFLMEGITEKGANEAIKMGNEALKSLRFVGGPTHAKEGNYDYCEYTTDEGYETYTEAGTSWS